MSDDALWVLARSTGLVSTVLLTLVVVLGDGSRAGWGPASLPRFVVTAVHRNAALLAVVVVAVHVVALLLDPYAHLQLLDLVVPFAAHYRPLWVGLGTLAAELLAAVVVTSLVRVRLGARTWRAVHWLSYAMWPMALAHGLGAGTDGGSLWVVLLTVACAVAGLAALAVRLAPRRGGDGAPPVPVPVADRGPR